MARRSCEAVCPSAAAAAAAATAARCLLYPREVSHCYTSTTTAAIQTLFLGPRGQARSRCIKSGLFGNARKAERAWTVMRLER